IYLRGRKDTANSAGVNDGEGCLDKIALLNAATINQKIAEDTEELKLMACERGVLSDELINRSRHGRGKALQNLNAEDVPHKTNERGALVMINPPQQFQSNVWMLVVKLGGEGFGFLLRYVLTIANLLEDWIAGSEFM